MKRYSLIFLFIAQQAIGQDFTEKKVTSKIKEATVFMQGAQITRTAKAEIIPGNSKLIVGSLSPYIDDRSVQVKATGEFTIVSVNHKLNYLSPIQRSSKIDSLKREIELLDSKINDHATRVEILREKQSVLNANKKLGGANTGASLAQLKQAIDFFDKELSSIKAEEKTAGLEIVKLKEQKTRIEKEINQVSGHQEPPTGQIEIRLESSKKTQGEFTISYIVANVGWFPKYDVRVESIDQPLDLKYKAEVYQNTGVDWPNVKLKLSNGNPNQSGVAPELQTWYLNYTRNNNSNNATYGMMSTSEKNTSGMDRVASTSDEAPSVKRRSMSSAMVAKSMVAATVVNQTTVEFEVEKPYSIKSNGEKLTVDLNSYKVEATYQYFAVPKLDKDAFLIARITNWDQYNLLEGEANLYFEDAYVGRSILDAKTLTDTLNISLGRDKNIVIGRTKVNEFSKRKTVGSNKIETRGFNIMVRNKKTQAITLTLFDQVPLAAISDIIVTPTQISKGNFKSTTGEVTWLLNMTPGQDVELKLEYEVKYPKNEQLVLE